MEPLVYLRAPTFPSLSRTPARPSPRAVRRAGGRAWGSLPGLLVKLCLGVGLPTFLPNRGRTSRRPKKGRTEMSIIWFIVVGLVAGLLARALLPGRQSMGLVATMLLGIVGSFVGGFIGSLFSPSRSVLDL